MTETEINIYSKIYDITEANLKKSGQDMVSYKETYLASLELDTSSADLSLLYNVPRDKYIQAIYYILFYRWILNNEEKNYDNSDLSDKEFKTELLNKLYNSTDRVTARRVVTNFVCASDNHKVSKFKRSLIKIYANIKAIIPLSLKTKVKETIMKIKA